ncbi:hypothetical protein [Microbispora sp. NPDC046933]|uniref:hypothetical protein n=1 Tax=Microbispora sp. NPDC046933 TaxID=3155618 RepID=UPI0033C372D7
MLGGLLLGTAGAACLPLVTPTGPYAALLPALLGLGLGMGLLTASVVAAALRAGPSSRPGLSSGVNNTARQAAGALGVAVLGALAGDSAEAGRFTGRASATPPPPRRGRTPSPARTRPDVTATSCSTRASRTSPPRSVRVSSPTVRFCRWSPAWPRARTRRGRSPGGRPTTGSRSRPAARDGAGSSSLCPCSWPSPGARDRTARRTCLRTSR